MAELMRDRLRYRGPDVDAEGVLVDRFDIGGANEPFGAFIANLHYEAQGRGCEPGTYARLIVDDQLWMSDTTSERKDHLAPVFASDLHKGGRGLVNGLGLGCVVGAMLDSLEHVDVVELDERIIRTIGAWYVAEYPGRVTIHHGDAYKAKWLPNTYWDVVWHDIWPTIASDNLPGMATLHRKYGRRAGWQGSWCEHEARWMRTKEAEWGALAESLWPSPA